MNEIEPEAYVAGIIKCAREAQSIINGYTQQQVDQLVGALAWGITRPAVKHELAVLALEETGYGNYESKLSKIEKKAKGVYSEIKHVSTVGIVERMENGLSRACKPVGVIGALIPVTQPEMTPIVKALFSVKCRDSIIFCAHPGGRRTTCRTVEIMRGILSSQGAPEDILICPEECSMSITGQVMKQCDLVIATGGAGMVKAAYSSGTPAFGVGAGNACIVVDDTADIPDAAHKIKISKTTDLAAGCSCDNSVIIFESVYNEMIEALKLEGGYFCTGEEVAKLRSALFPSWPENHALNRDLVARSAGVIARAAGIEIPEGTSFIIVPESGTGHGHPFSGEKLSVVLAVYKCTDISLAINTVNAIHAYSGAGHSCGIYSRNEANIEKYALETRTTRCNVNLPNAVANSGDVTSGMPYTCSLGCGTWGGNIVSKNICLDCYYNNTWIATPTRRELPSDEELFGDIDIKDI